MASKQKKCGKQVETCKHRKSPRRGWCSRAVSPGPARDNMRQHDHDGTAVPGNSKCCLHEYEQSRPCRRSPTIQTTSHPILVKPRVLVALAGALRGIDSITGTMSQPARAPHCWRRRKAPATKHRAPRGDILSPLLWAVVGVSCSFHGLGGVSTFLKVHYGS